MSAVQQPTSMEPMIPTDGGGCRPPGDSQSSGHVQTKRPLDPHTSIEDYSRIMLEYTHNRMASFADTDDDRGSSRSRSSRGSETSGKSGDSSSTGLSRPSVPASNAGISHHDFAAAGTASVKKDVNH